MKRRLLGTVVVVGLIVVVVPMLVSGPKSSDQTVVKTITIPTDPTSAQQPAQAPAPADRGAGEDDGAGRRAPMVPNPDEVTADTGAATENAMKSAPDATQPDTASAAPRTPATPPRAPVQTAPDQSRVAQTVPDTSPPPAEPAATPKPQPRSAPEKSGAHTASTGAAVPTAPVGQGDWGVQVGSFSEAQNAEGVAKKLRNEGFKVFITQAQVGDITVHRVRVGAFASQNSASQEAQKLEASLGHGVQVLKVR